MTNAIFPENSEARAALKAHATTLRMAPVVLDDAIGVASLDMTGQRPILVLLAKKPNGEIVHSRGPVDIAALPADRSAGAAAIVQRAVDVTPLTPASDPSNIGFSEAIDWFGLRSRPSGFAERFASSFALAYPNFSVPRGDVIDLVDARLPDWGTRNMASALDGEALRALRAAKRFSKAAYAFFAARNNHREDRLQAAASYPLLAKTMVAKVPVKIAIDQRKPLGEVLEFAFGSDSEGRPKLTKSTLRRLQKIDWSDRDTPIETLVETMSALPPDWFPKSEPEWNAFLDVTDTFFRYLPRAIDQRADELASGCAGKWLDFRARIAKAAAPDLPPDDLTEEEKAAWKPVIDESHAAMRSACSGVLDMIHHFRDMMILPIAASRSDRDEALSEAIVDQATAVAGRLLCRGKSLPAILEMQKFWHTQRAHLMESVEIEAVDPGNDTSKIRGSVKTVAQDGWPPLTDIVVAPNGVTIIPLTDPRELLDEGAGYSGHAGYEGSMGKLDRYGMPGLAHCVGGYAGDCRNKGHHIVSFRIVESETQYKRLSTAEFYPLQKETNTLRMKQHRGKHNETPPKLAQAAFDWYVNEISVGNIMVNREGIMTYFTNFRREIDDIRHRAGYDRHNTVLLESGLRAWNAFLPKKMRGLDVTKFRELPDMENLVETITPSYAPATRF